MKKEKYLIKLTQEQYEYLYKAAYEVFGEVITAVQPEDMDITFKGKIIFSNSVQLGIDALTGAGWKKKPK